MPNSLESCYDDCKETILSIRIDIMCYHKRISGLNMDDSTTLEMIDYISLRTFYLFHRVKIGFQAMSTIINDPSIW
ncbi:unnamed protein product [Rhizophagus irregularis]|nr:unnamed protein product [Rhizophagus irregularis]CAB5370720.1 unnamed protein product [Rhizophagus irregularis]